jgi:hypothetical protein
MKKLIEEENKRKNAAAQDQNMLKTGIPSADVIARNWFR